MKKLLIVIPSYRWGGDTTALFNLLNRLDPAQFKIDLFPLIDEGPYRERYANCTLLKGSSSVEALLKKFQFSLHRQSIRSFALKSLNRLSRGRFIKTVYKSVGRKLRIKDNYDAIIAWTEWEPTAFVAALSHKHKIAWIHCDYAFNKHSANDDAAYREMNQIICVSHFCTNSFSKLFPDLSGRVKTVYDVLNIPQIFRKSQVLIDDFPIGKGFNLLSAGRIAPGKRFSFIPEIAARIRDAGIDFHWAIIGPNQHPDELERIQDNIIKYNVQDKVAYLGVKANPFPYIKQADLVVNPSQSEALSYAILEAAVLGTPTVNADFEVAHEVLTHGKNGIIVPIEEIADAIICYLTDENLRNVIKKNLKNYPYDDDAVLQDFYQLFS